MMPIHAQLASRKDANRRRAGRKVLRLATSGRTPKGYFADVLIHDLSTGGMLIETQAGFSLGDELEVTLPRTGARLAKVVWSSGDFFGCRFTDPIPPAAVSASLLKAEPKSAEGAQARRGGSDLSARISALRSSRNWTIDDLARRLGVSRQAVWYWETGQRAPRAELFRRIAEVFDVTERELFAGEPTPGKAADEVEICRNRLAEALGVRAENIRILVEM